MRKQNKNISGTAVLLSLLASILGAGILAAPSEGFARPAIRGGHATIAAAAPANQDAGQATPAPATPPAAAPAAPKKVELPEGDGKPIATEYCQDCHRLTNLTRAHKSEDDWKETVQTMMDRGARLPQENFDTLVAYLTKNFGPKTDAPVADAQASTPASAAPAASPSTDVSAKAAAAAPAAALDPTAPSTPAAPKKVELPDGDGKVIATENCQACHRLTNLVKAHKSLDEWRDTVQLMIDRGANIQPDQVETLVQYLAKNFGPKPADPAAGTPSAGAGSNSSSQSQ